MIDQSAPARPAQLWHLLGFVAINVVVSGFGGLLTATSIDSWYPALAKPSFNPPDWIFGPVWSILYLLMAVAAWRVWRVAGWNEGRISLSLYFGQLALNLLWSALFFGLRQPAWALADCLLLLALIIVTGVLFWRRDRLAGILFVPYTAWVGFAALLNGAIVALN
ncbi:TspO/MBR family protein [Dongia rigui]|uniref:TspO/MBR family protein n=1 Tax=Dongia rigui TaxID=940149 RepID=A0ABU5DV22_9PROT|nr:TspO/MBR family protein [Dongia rigui]MDY0870784.1 TspO/MBR family protein [Dongia rigui]